MVYFKRALGLAVLAVIMVALLLAASWVVMPKDNTTQAGMEDAAANGILGESANTIDLCVIGDSEAYRSISPLLLWKQTGGASYVCATSAQKLTYSKIMLERAFQKQRPKVVLLETLAIYRTITPGDVFLNELSNYFPVFRYHNRWKTLQAKDFTGPVQATATDQYKGHHPTKNVDPCQPGQYMVPTEKVAPIPRINRAYVQWLKNLCDEHGARMILMSMPSPVNWNYSKHNGIKDLANQLGCDYVDLNLKTNELGIDWNQDTYDQGDHLNHYGAIKVTNYLAKMFQNMGVLTDHRGQAGYEGWDQALRPYEEDFWR